MANYSLTRDSSVTATGDADRVPLSSRVYPHTPVRNASVNISHPFQTCYRGWRRGWRGRQPPGHSGKSLGAGVTLLRVSALTVLFDDSLSTNAFRPRFYICPRRVRAAES
eukprot:scaffold49881_cov58-Phaeocystis_antarctica.AAC.1